MKAQFISESLNESKSSPVDRKKLAEYAKGIAICCAGEYGDVFYNEVEQHIFVCLGDSNPFDDSDLKMFIKEAVIENYRDFEKVKVTIENECTPRGNGWEKI